jgi:hypothetical protein
MPVTKKERVHGGRCAEPGICRFPIVPGTIPTGSVIQCSCGRQYRQSRLHHGFLIVKRSRGRVPGERQWSIDRVRQEVYVRCIACKFINTISAPEVVGEGFIYEDLGSGSCIMCPKCEVHFWMYLDGWEQK